jgi:predicted phage-related endonuclease
MIYTFEERSKAIFATDARQIADGHAAEVYLKKTDQAYWEERNKFDPASQERMNWGLLLQESIGIEASNRLKVALKDADYELTHAKHGWMRSHFDFISEDGKTLVEVKNYNAMKRNQYDPETGLMPVADSVQCIHEAAVHNVERVVLAVLFGGQELVLIDKQITEEEKERLIKSEAAVWGAIQARTPPMPTTPDEARKLFPSSTDNSALANSHVEQVAAQLKTIKEHIKKLEEQEAKQQAYLQAAMKDASSLVTFDGRVLATWKSAKGSMSFDKSALEKEMPEVYQRYMTETTGSRRFLLK